MSASNFKPSLALVLAHEGGYVNHLRDPGGATNKGVTQKVYDAYRKYHGLATRTVKEIAPAEVAEIYQKNYWKLCRGDSLPCGLDYAVFDFAVNSGVSRAVRYLQKTVSVEQDGVLGVVSLAAIDSLFRQDAEALIIRYCANRMAFLASLPIFSVFGKGWTRRVVGYNAGAQETDNGVVDYAIKMVRRQPVFNAPSSIGTKPNEIPAKAVAPIEPESFPVASAVAYSPENLRQLVMANDRLAAIVNG